MIPDDSQDVVPDLKSTGPTIIERFVGQQQVVDQVRVGLESSWNDTAAFPHTLMVGPPGVGKTQMAKIIAAEMGSPLHETLSNTLHSSADLNALLLKAGDRDVVFLDEGDELPKQPFQTLLYRALEERKLFLTGSTGGSIPLKNFTLLIATNHESALVAPLRERFKLVLRFDYYASEHLAVIVTQRAQALRWECEAEVFARIAALGRGIPRRAIQMLEACHRFARSRGEHVITTEHCDKTCQLEGLCAQYGLDQTEQKYLRLLLDAGGSPLRVGTLSARLGIPPRTLSGVIETYLLRLGLIARQNDGRELTAMALEYFQRMELSK